ncbi:ArgE/DapE family deacylase [Virgibacillus kimchii]
MNKKELENQFSEEDIITLCQKLVRIPSENPPGDTREIAEFVYEYLVSRGLPAKKIAPQSKMPNVVCTVEGEGEGPHLVFNGHLDTYPAGEKTNWDYHPYEATIDNGRIYGRGVADMKAGVACSLYAFTMLAKSGGWSGKLSITLVSDEETGGTWGTEYLLREYPELRGDALLNGEPTSCQMVSMGEKGNYWIKLIAQNKGGHGAYIFQKQSAVDSMLNCLIDFRKYETLKAELPREVKKEMEQSEQVFDALRGQGSTKAAQEFSMNIGMINGGTNVNTQAESCEAYIDLRIPPGGTLGQAQDFVKKTLKEHPNVSMELIKETKPTLSSPNNKLFQVVKENAELIRQKQSMSCFTFGLTDARYWRLYNIPAAVYGPNHYNMGSANEYIEVNDLIQAGKVHLLASWDYLTN